MKRSLLTLLVVAMPLTASAQTIYKCVDASGGTVIANSRIEKNCKAIVSGPENTLPAPKARPAGAAANPSPAGFPRVGEDTQKSRDGDRRHILEQELAGEQRNLEQAKKELAEQEAAKGGPSDRTAPYRDRVSQHERNIQAIQKELGNLK
ncbi:DUF4124 domain-containing protein [Dechloromonas sp. XY25]|uniref:DUF4124 domain-containing protein n=1 Tax=Dechloromonas hankyongensis TaxID=2908002 RepID=A0ABS9JX03_9RHOO|nr:DUF4124 domain-containing protein [Dechloromonas hankyongensis]MCG2575427.1 DUF4124 domain-containing protein [Dechloromonas hankyongensis]